jgi:hypothetical protein
MPKESVLAIRCSALLVTMLVAQGARAAEPAGDIGVLPPSQLPPSQPPPPGSPPPTYPPPSQPPPTYPQYQQVPTYPQYQQQQQQGPYYQPLAPAYREPRSRAYRDGDPIPPGYHVEERPRSGLVTGGLIMVLVPYSIGAFATIAAKFGNESTWLLAPVLGPWMTIGQRSYYSCSRNGSAGDSLGCVADVFVVMGLIVSGVVQAAGATLLLTGYLNPKETLVRDEAALRVRPMTIGTGYGLGLEEAF